ncbi:MAG: PfkB family carbohydrate kinase [Saprospiraceae bacterium]
MTTTAEIFNAFNKLNILIVGDVMIDRYLSGSVTRISPEAPVPVVHLKESQDRLGGAANVALNIKALGATPYLCSCIGADENGTLFEQLLPAHQLQEKGLIRSKDRITTVKTRVLSNHQHLLRVDREDTHDLSSEDEMAYLAKIREILNTKTIHLILFQDYNKGVLTYKVIQKIILEAIKRDIPTVVDPKFKHFWAYKKVSLFKPNLREIQQQLPFEVKPTIDSLKKASEEIKSKLGNKHTLITLSEKGLFYDSEGEIAILPTQARQIADVCGAGDTVISIVALGMALSLGMHQIANLANLAGGQVCEKVGVVPVDKAQLLQEYEDLLGN